MTVFDPDAGLLRLRHPALAVLAVLADDPTSTRLHDHGVAPLLAELRGAGLVGPRGVHPDVAPLAAAVARPQRTFELHVDDHGVAHAARGWVGGDLAVVGVVVDAAGEAYELMADAPGRLPELVAELVGLGPVAAPPVHGRRTLAVDDAATVLASGDRSAAAAALGAAADDPWASALADGCRGAGLRWRLRVDGGADLEVLDAGQAGVWEVLRGETAAEVGAVDAPALRTRLRSVLAVA